MNKSTTGSECSAKLWGGRFTQSTSDCLAKLNNNLEVDRRLFAEDIEGSVAYARGLEKINLLANVELQLIERGLSEVLTEWETEKIEVMADDEDVHTVNERRLTELVGAVGGKLHTGRSRNDQVATDLRLWTKKAIVQVILGLVELITEMVHRSEELVDVIMPGYTHLQRAQPVRFSHWLLSHAFAIEADCERFKAVYKRTDYLPLGSGAIAGNPFAIDRKSLAQSLSFKDISMNSMHAVSDRDFVADFLYTASLCAIHLSRFAEDLILFSSQEFGFVKLADEYSTGSSLMPQKRNPDSLELVRGLSGTIFGQMCGFMMTIKGTPSTYNKDLQNDKKPMFSVYDTLTAALKVTRGVTETMAVDEQRCNQALSVDMLATDLAYFLVRKGIPFREAHHTSGKVIAFAEAHNTSIDRVTVAELKEIHPLFDESTKLLWNFEHSVEQYSAIGGTSRKSVGQQIDVMKEYVSKQESFPG